MVVISRVPRLLFPALGRLCSRLPEAVNSIAGRRYAGDLLRFLKRDYHMHARHNYVKYYTFSSKHRLFLTVQILTKVIWSSDFSNDTCNNRDSYNWLNAKMFRSFSIWVLWWATPHEDLGYFLTTFTMQMIKRRVNQLVNWAPQTQSRTARILSASSIDAARQQKTVSSITNTLNLYTLKGKRF